MCSWRKGRLKDCLERNGSVEGGAGIMYVFFLMRIRVQNFAVTFLSKSRS